MTERIKEALKAHIPTYDPGVKIGEVKQSYCVVHDLGTTPKENCKGLLGQRVYEIVVLVPLKEQQSLDKCCNIVREALKPIKELKYTGDMQESQIEETYRGLSKSLVYRKPEFKK